MEWHFIFFQHPSSVYPYFHSKVHTFISSLWISICWHILLECLLLKSPHQLGQCTGPKCWQGKKIPKKTSSPFASLKLKFFLYLFFREFLILISCCHCQWVSEPNFFRIFDKVLHCFNCSSGRDKFLMSNEWQQVIRDRWTDEWYKWF